MHEYEYSADEYQINFEDVKKFQHELVFVPKHGYSIERAILQIKTLLDGPDNGLTNDVVIQVNTVLDKILEIDKRLRSYASDITTIMDAEEPYLRQIDRFLIAWMPDPDFTFAFFAMGEVNINNAN